MKYEIVTWSSQGGDKNASHSADSDYTDNDSDYFDATNGSSSDDEESCGTVEDTDDEESVGTSGVEESVGNPGVDANEGTRRSSRSRPEPDRFAEAVFYYEAMEDYYKAKAKRESVTSKTNNDG